MISLYTRAMRVLWPPLAYLLLTVPMTWPLATQLGTNLPGLGDAQLQAWTIAWNSYAFRTNPSAIWDAPIFFPYADTLAYTDNHLLLSLLVAPLVWATGNPLLAHNVLLLASFALSGWAVYGLGYQLTCQRWPAFIAGAAFSFCAYRLSHLIQLNLLQTAWLPFALLFLIRLLRPHAKGGGQLRDGLLCGIFAGVQAVTALYYAFFTAAVLCGYAGLWALDQLWKRVRQAAPLPWRTCGLLLLSGGLALAIALPFTLPYTRVYASLGIVRSVRELENWSAPLRAYWSFDARSLLYSRFGERFVDSGEMVLSPGFTIALLGLSGLLLALRSRDGRFWGLVISCAFVLSLGTGLRFERYGDPLPVPLPYLTLYNYLPGFGALRVPARWGLLVTLGLSVLSSVASAYLLSRTSNRQRHFAGAALLIIVLSEQALSPLSMPDANRLTNPPPVYSWLAAPDQRDIQAVLELPVDAIPRGDEIERIIWRQWYSQLHGKALPVAYSGLIPFGTLDLLRYAQSPFSPAALQFFQIIGIDTLVVHSEQYDPAALRELQTGLEDNLAIRLRAEVGTSIIYSLLPIIALDIGPSSQRSESSVCISADERVPGMIALALARRWERADLAIYGPGRLRYYGPLRQTTVGQICDYGLLATAEDPLDHGYLAIDRLWEGSGVALYQRSSSVQASLNLGAPVPGQFHPQYAEQLRITRTAEELLVGTVKLVPMPPAEPQGVAIDIIAHSAATLSIDMAQIQLQPGLNTITIPLSLDRPLIVAGQPNIVALLRLRLLAERPAQVSSQAIDGTLVAAAAANYSDGLLTVTAQAAGADRLLLDVWGAASYDDRPVHLLAGSQPLARSGSELDFTIDLLRPQANWLEQSAAPQDGRYIVYIKDAARPDGPGRPVAKFAIRNGQVADFEPVPLPLTVVR